jgi:hypothetical protein
MSRVLEQGWTITEKEFPSMGAPEEKLRYALEYAVLAPSSRNAQPWLFKIADDTVDVYADRTRSLPVIDPNDREMIIACGTSLFYLRLALYHFGQGCAVEILPDASDPDLLARVRLLPSPVSGPDDAVENELLFQSIPRRHTNRLTYEDREVREGLLAALQESARSEGAWLYVVREPAERYSIAHYIAESDQDQWANPEYRQELADWVRENATTERDGIPSYALGISPVEAPVAPLMMSVFDLSDMVERKDYKLVMTAPALVMLGTDADNPACWLAAGQALAKVLLRAAAEGVSASFFNQVIEIEKVRAWLHGATQVPNYPQLLFRLGYGPFIKPTPRRPVDDVLL